MFFSKTIWNFLWSSAKPDSHNFKVWFFTEDTVSGEGIFTSVFSSGEETGNKIVGREKNLSLLSEFLVMEEPIWPSIPIEHFVGLINTDSTFIWMVYKESLVIIDNKWCWWKRFNIIFYLNSNFFWLGSSLYNLFNDFFFFQ